MGVEKNRLRNVRAQKPALERPAYDHSPVIKYQHRGAAMPNIQAAIKPQEEIDVDCRHYHAGEITVSVVNSPRHGHGPLSGRTAEQGLANAYTAIRVALMKDKIIPVRVVIAAQFPGLCAYDQLTGPVKNKQTVELRQLGQAGRK